MTSKELMLAKLLPVEPLIGNTPVLPLAERNLRLYVKLEYNNLSGSIKDRAALHIIKQGILKGVINEETTIVESSSGNFAIALATICKYLGLSFIPVIDPNINADYEKILMLLTRGITKVSDRDHTGGFLLNRIAKVQEICEASENVFWTNQYENPDNSAAYHIGLAEEVCSMFNTLDYAFIGVSSGGTIAGISLRLKEKYPSIKIVGVDVEGSVIFGGPPSRRNLSGIGSSRRSPIIEQACIDDVVLVSEPEIVLGCNQLLQRHNIFGGASCGAAYQAICNYHRAGKIRKNSSVLFLCPDKGHGYLDTVYNPDWVSRTYPHAHQGRSEEPEMDRLRTALE